MMISLGSLVLCSNGPTLQNVQADSTEAVDVWVVDFGKEADLGRGHGVVVGQEQFELEDSTWIVCQSRSDRVGQDWVRVPS
jgi:hypothetical protein